MPPESKEAAETPETIPWPKPGWDLITSYSSLAIALSAVLLLSYTAIEVHNTSVALTDRATRKRLEARIAELEKSADELRAARRTAAELLDVSERLQAARDEREDNRQAVARAEMAVRNVKPARGRGHAKGAAAAKTRAERELASLRTRSDEIRAEIEKSTRVLTDKLKGLATGPTPQKSEPEGSLEE